MESPPVVVEARDGSGRQAVGSGGPGVESEDAMAVERVSLACGVLAKISDRILNEVRGIHRVVLDISSKPQATIEWE